MELQAIMARSHFQSPNFPLISALSFIHMHSSPDSPETCPIGQRHRVSHTEILRNGSPHFISPAMDLEINHIKYSGMAVPVCLHPSPAFDKGFSGRSVAVTHKGEEWDAGGTQPAESRTN